MVNCYEYDYDFYFFALGPLSGLVTPAILALGPDDSHARAIAIAIATHLDRLYEAGISPPKNLTSSSRQFTNDSEGPEVIPMFADQPEGPFILKINGHLEPTEICMDLADAETTLERLKEKKWGS